MSVEVTVLSSIKQSPLTETPIEFLGIKPSPVASLPTLEPKTLTSLPEMIPLSLMLAMIP